MITRDQYEPLREDLAKRMQTEQGRKVYARRAPIVEGVFAQIKSALGIRRFTCRGKEKVTSEWLWICTAYNLMKLIRSRGNAAPKQPNSPHPSSRALRCITQLVQLAWKYHFRAPINSPGGKSRLKPLNPNIFSRYQSTVQLINTP
jgi:hypothetical protein